MWLHRNCLLLLPWQQPQQVLEYSWRSREVRKPDMVCALRNPSMLALMMVLLHILYGCGCRCQPGGLRPSWPAWTLQHCTLHLLPASQAMLAAQHGHCMLLSLTPPTLPSGSSSGGHLCCTWWWRSR